MVHPHSNLVRMVDNVVITTSSLTALTALVGASRIDASREQGFKTLMQRGFLKWKDNDGSGGPLMAGMVQPGLNVAEIKEMIENDPQDSVDTPAKEQAERKYFLLGYLNSEDGSHAFTKFQTTHQIPVIEGATLNLFVYNTGSSSLDAANTFQFFVEHLGVWLRD